LEAEPRVSADRREGAERRRALGVGTARATRSPCYAETASTVFAQTERERVPIMDPYNGAQWAYY